MSLSDSRAIRRFGFALGLSAYLYATTLPAAEIHGRVVSVADGDTLTVLDANHQQHRIRLAGIDAPEKKQAHGNRSKVHLSDLVFGKSVSVDWTKKDKYGRSIGKVLVGSTDANLQQIKAGLAWHCQAYEKSNPCWIAPPMHKLS